MDFKKRLDRYRAEAKQAGIPPALIGALPYQILWLLGVPITPPLHQSFVARTLTVGIPAGLFFGVAMAFVPQKEGPGVTPVAAVAMGIAFGVLFGVFWAALVGVMGRKYKNPPWDDDIESRG